MLPVAVSHSPAGQRFPIVPNSEEEIVENAMTPTDIANNDTDDEGIVYYIFVC